jgi:hypothetical protein
VLRRSLVWSLFILSVMATATMTAAAETRLLGPPTVDATPLPTCLDTDRTSATVDLCQRQALYQAYLASVRKVQTPCPYVGPAAGDACSAALVNNYEALAEGRVQADATWAAGADAICQQGPPSVGTQEMCDHVAAFRAAQSSTPVVLPPWCAGIAAPDPRCTGN